VLHVLSLVMFLVCMAPAQAAPPLPDAADIEQARQRGRALIGEAVSREDGHLEERQAFSEAFDQARTQAPRFRMPDIDHLPAPQADALEKARKDLARLLQQPDKALDDLLASAQAPSNKAPAPILFVSFSMPETALRRYLEQAARLDATVVLRGFVGDSMKTTLERILGLLYPDGLPTREEDARVPEAYAGLSLAIDPTLYERFGITRVPALVLPAEPVPSCTPEGCPAPEHVGAHPVRLLLHAGDGIAPLSRTGRPPGGGAMRRLFPWLLALPLTGQAAPPTNLPEAFQQGLDYANSTLKGSAENAARSDPATTVPGYAGTDVPETGYQSAGVGLTDEARARVPFDPNTQWYDQSIGARPKFTLDRNTDPIFQRTDAIQNDPMALAPPDHAVCDHLHHGLLHRMAGDRLALLPAHPRRHRHEDGILRLRYGRHLLDQDPGQCLWRSRTMPRRLAFFRAQPRTPWRTADRGAAPPLGGGLWLYDAHRTGRMHGRDLRLHPPFLYTA